MAWIASYILTVKSLSQRLVEPDIVAHYEVHYTVLSSTSDEHTAHPTAPSSAVHDKVHT